LGKKQKNKTKNKRRCSQKALQKVPTK